MENWLPVVGFEGVYEVSNLGGLRSVDRDLASGRWGHVRRKGQPIKTKVSNKGREVVGLRLNGTRKWFGVHQLVCAAFHGSPPSPEHEVAHFPDKDPMNNAATNLRWATRLENHNDRRIHETTFPGEKNYFAQITESDVREIRRLYLRGRPCHPGNQNDLAERFRLHPKYVMQVANGKAWSHVK